MKPLKPSHRAAQNLRIIDALGPFMEDNDREIMNWSKVHFSDLETSGRITAATQRRIIGRFERYTQQIAALGYNALSVDDLAHLVTFPFYGQPLQTLLADYGTLYQKLFAIAKKYQFK